MATNFEKACKGNPQAMKALYDANKSIVAFLSFALLGNDTTADNATSQIFKATFEALLNGEIATEEDFSRYLETKTVNYCKTRLAKKDSKEFKIPKNKNFMIQDFTNVRFKEEMSLAEIVLINLPAIHRFIYVLHYVCKYTDEEICKLLNIEKETVILALKSEEYNIVSLYGALAKKSSLLEEKSVLDFHDSLVENTTNYPVSQNLENTININIQNLCTPILQRNRKKKIKIYSILGVAVIALCFVAGLVLINANGTTSTSSDNSSSTNTDTSSSIATTLDTSLKYYADIDISDYGTVTVELDAKAAPKTVENFVSLSKSGFYNGLTFHRIIEGFMMQGGDPNGNGTGGSENTITGEFTSNGFENNLSHTRGAISMARSNDYNSASSQFFIVHKDSTQSLDGLYAAFGYVTEGMDIVDTICESAQPTDDNGTIPAEDQPIIKTITIRTVDNAQTDKTTNNNTK